MSIGNLKDQGNKGNNFPYQLKTLQLLGAINDSISALPGVDYETRTSTYEANTTVAGQYNQGNIIVRYDIIDVADETLFSTMWFNQTLQTTLLLPPAPANLTPISAPSGVTVLNGSGAQAVNIQDGGNSITVDGTFWQATQPVNQIEKTGVSGLTTAITGTVATDVIVAPGAGLFNYITQILVTNSDDIAGTVVTLQDDTGFPIYSGYAGPAGGGFSVSLPTPIKMPSANTKLQAICSIAANVYVSASGYKAA
jgi:hypothetical protein